MSGGKTENMSRGSSVSGRYESNGSGWSAINRSRVGSWVAFPASLSLRSIVERRRCATLPSIMLHVSVSPSSVSWSTNTRSVSSVHSAERRPAARPTVAPLAHLHLANLLLQPLERLPELTQVPTLLPPLLEVLILGPADRGRLVSKQRFVLGVSGRERRHLRGEGQSVGVGWRGGG